MKGRQIKLKDRGAIVLQLQRAVKLNRNRENGKKRERDGEKCCNKGADEKGAEL